MNTYTASHKAAHATANRSMSDDTTVAILIDGQPVCFQYEELKTFHQGDSWFGCAVGFRTMQLAAREFSVNSLWTRDELTIVSGHPGAGVKDAIELVSGAVSSNRFQLLDSIATQGCNRSMRFEWWLSNTEQTLHIKLRDGIVPETFFILLDRLSKNGEQDDKLTDAEKEDQRKHFDQIKSDLSDEVWNQSLDASFEFVFLTTPLKAGEMPDA